MICIHCLSTSFLLSLARFMDSFSCICMGGLGAFGWVRGGWGRGGVGGGRGTK